MAAHRHITVRLRLSHHRPFWRAAAGRDMASHGPRKNPIGVTDQSFPPDSAISTM